MVFGGDQAAHIEGGADHGTAAPGRASTPQGPAVTVQWRHPNQGGDLLVRQRTPLRQLREQGPTHDGTDAWHAAQQVLLFTPDRRGLDPMGQVFVQGHQLFLQPRQVNLNLPLDRARCPLHPVLLRYEPLNQLAPSREQRTECLRGFIR